MVLFLGCAAYGSADLAMITPSADEGSIEAYTNAEVQRTGGKLQADHFAVTDYPRIEYRGHWVWGCNMPDKYYNYMRTMQQWARNFLSKKSVNKHGSTVADHSVFCRRTPFMHVALAEAQWNPDMDTEARVDAMVDLLELRSPIQSTGKTTIQHEAMGKTVTLQNQYSPKYTAGGAKGLADGKVSGSNAVGEACWQ